MLAHDERSLAVLVSYRAELHELQERLERQRPRPFRRGARSIARQVAGRRPREEQP
jgi:hypothetical protein